MHAAQHLPSLDAGGAGALALQEGLTTIWLFLVQGAQLWGTRAADEVQANLCLCGQPELQSDPHTIHGLHTIYHNTIR